MEFDDDFDTVYMNRVKTFGDILDSPILTTIKRDIFNSLSLARGLSAPISKTYSQDGSASGRLIELALIKALCQKQGVHRLGHLDRSCVSLACRIVKEQAPVIDLDVATRFQILNALTESSNPSFSDPKKAVFEAGRLYDTVRDGIGIQLNSNATPLMKRKGPRLEPLEIYSRYSRADQLLEMIIHNRQEQGLQNRQGSINCIVHHDWLSQIWIEGDVVLFKTEGALYSTSWDDFLCIRSMAIYRRNSFLLIAIDHSIPATATSSLLKLLQWQEHCIFSYGNPGYELAKAVESVFKARLMQLGDGQCVGDAFELMIVKQMEKEAKLTRDKTSPLVERLRDLALSVKLPREAAELFGCLKFSGHPHIDPEIASQSARSHGTAKGNPGFGETMRMRAEFCDMLLKGYIKKHARWPPLIHSPGRKTKLQRLHEKRVLVFGPHDYDYQDWYYSAWPKLLDFDYNIDYLDMMDDKSTGLDPQDAWKAWDSCKRDAPSLAHIPNERSKKLIIRILSMKEFDPKAICEQIRVLNMSLADISMSLYPKEREFKLEARLFVMLEFSVRVFLTLAEKNFKRLLKDYLPDQSMTKGRKGTMQHLEGMAARQSNPDIDTVFIEVDLSRWNLLWRGVVVDPVSNIADSIFGLPGAFSKGHEIFENSTVVVRVSTETPDGVVPGSFPREWPESKYVWRNHLGGFEGIMQAQWTACTQAEIKAVMRDLDVVSYKLLGQGDNQILEVSYNRDYNKNQMVQALEVSARCTEELSRRFSRLNQVIKPDECLASRSTVTYSKICWQDGVLIPTTLKHAATVAPVGTSNIPGLVVGLSAISSGCRASADAFIDPSMGYLYFLILFREYLPRASRTLPSKQLLNYTWSQDQLDSASTIPGDLGGLPIQIPTDFCFGGTSDRLSSSVAALVCLSHVNRNSQQYLGYLETSLPWKPDPDPATLLEDPFSVPILPSVGADVQVDQAIKTVVPSITQNIDLKQIMSTSVDEFGKSLSSFLTRLKPFYPLLMADLVELSVIGVKKKVFKKFTGTRTIQQLVRNNAPINYGHAVIYADYKRVTRLRTFMSQSSEAGLTGSFPSRSIFSRVVKYRERWFPDGSNKLEGVTVLHPLEAIADSGLKLQSPDYIEFTSHVPWGAMMSTKGPHPGRWGDKTWEHRRVTGVEVIGTQKAALAAKRLLMMESQLTAGGELKKAIRGVLRQRTTVDERDLEIFMPTVIGGVAAHRWDSTVEEKAFAWLGPISLTQHSTVQTDSMSSLSGGVKDYSFCFQEHSFFGLQCMRASPDAFNGNPTLRLHYDISPEMLITSVPVTAEGKAPELSLARDLQKNPLVCASNILYQALSDEMPATIAPIWQTPPSCSTEVGIRLMIHHFLDQLENPVLSEAAVDAKDAPSGLSLDVGSLIGVGLQPMMVAAGRAVFLRSIEMSLSETGLMDRVILSAYIDALSGVAALPLARFANNPQVRQQAWVQASGVLIAPGRHGSSVLKSRLSSYIRDEAHRCYRDIRNLSNSRMILSSYAERATPSRVLGCYVACSIVLLGLRGSVDDCRKIYRRHLNGLRNLVRETDRITHHVTILNLLSNPEFEESSVLATEILEGRVLTRTAMSFEDSKRYLRTGPRSNASQRLITSPSPPTIVAWQIGVAGEFPLSSPVSKPLLTLDRRSDSLRLVSRNLGWSIGGSSISRLSYRILSVISSALRQGPVLCVGVGNGAMARDAFALGATCVIGVDLLSDLPSVSSLGTGYLPPEIPVVDPTLNWRWAKGVFNHGGDWFDEKVHSDVLSEQPGVICIDIQPGRRMIWEDILPILKSMIRTIVVTRRELTPPEASLFYQECRGTFSSFCMFKSTINETEYWLLARTSGCQSVSRPTSAVEPVFLRLDPLDSPPLDSPFYPNQFELNRTTLVKGRVPPGVSLGVAKDYLLTFVDWSMSKRSHRRGREVTEDIVLALYLLSRLNSMFEHGPLTKEELTEQLADLAQSSAPLEIQGHQVPAVRQAAIFNMASRVLPRLMRESRNRWSLQL
ncbi:RNA-dependent RNA polymerase [Sclerotinia sclerotiorum negative-stranded RNA virus 4]|uniref:RNA-directed RNA polymerase n=1 Tax=Sclerotinia sclerotiorum negative-stranded RNA virus 4 TaxID=1708391 RepID=A0A0M3SUQ2_9MONO|nr:RNA-dependent RNA polymerase [Sclerotinia sclerotiorum negative-stranded RNA virus 4]ALD89140.1 RNA-dependent RNA polymerase [Sclerotinia sclerotiorum negative-stranded RNA virus 4]